MSVPKHIVAVAGLVTDSQGRILLLLSPRGDWEFPGGQVEEGEALTAALVREVREETGIIVTVGALAGVYSNVQSHIVMLDFICEYVGGELRASNESLTVEWLEPSDALARVKRPVIRDRLQDMLEFEGEIVYRAYTFNANEIETEYTIREERHI